MGGTAGGSTTTSGGGSGGTSGGDICSTQRCVVYASADHDLYQVDPTTLLQQHLCAFNGALSSADVVTDIAVAQGGTLYGITESALYAIDPQSCAATQVATLSQAGRRWVGLSFTATGVLLAADGQGNVVNIDTASGQITTAGQFGGTLACSGDLVSINDSNHTIYATATDSSCVGTTCADKLVTLNPTSYAATVVGSLGYRAVYGLGFWAGKLYGFTHAGQTLQIDPATARASVIQTTSPAVLFSGGATTPIAPVEPR